MFCTLSVLYIEYKDEKYILGFYVKFSTQFQCIHSSDNYVEIILMQQPVSQVKSIYLNVSFTLISMFTTLVEMR